MSDTTEASLLAPLRIFWIRLSSRVTVPSVSVLRDRLGSLSGRDPGDDGLLADVESGAAGMNDVHGATSKPATAGRLPIRQRVPRVLSWRAGGDKW